MHTLASRALAPPVAVAVGSTLALAVGAAATETRGRLSPTLWFLALTLVAAAVSVTSTRAAGMLVAAICWVAFLGFARGTAGELVWLRVTGAASSCCWPSALVRRTQPGEPFIDATFLWSSTSHPHALLWSATMLDVVFILLALAFFAVCGLLARGVERL